MITDWIRCEGVDGKIAAFRISRIFAMLEGDHHTEIYCYNNFPFKVKPSLEEIGKRIEFAERDMAAPTRPSS